MAIEVGYDEAYRIMAQKLADALVTIEVLERQLAVLQKATFGDPEPEDVSE